MGGYRVLQLATSLNRGTGVAGFMMNYWRAIDPDQVHFDFAVHLVKPENYIEEVEKEGSRVYTLPEITMGNLRGTSEAIRALAEKVADSYDAVHCHMPNMAFLHFPLWKRFGTERRIVHSHTTESSPYALRRLRNSIVEPLGLRYATDRLASSESAGLSAYGNASFQVVPNAVDMSTFKPSTASWKTMRQKYNLGGKNVIGYVGRLAKGKNVKFLIDVLACLDSRSSNYALLLVGSGEEEATLRNYAEERSVGDKVLFVGYRPDTEMFYNAMDVFLFPSRAEGLGLVAVEAQACGVPCILSRGIPAEADVSGTSLFMSVQEGAERWAEAVRSVLLSETKINRNLVTASPFNVGVSAPRLASFYLRGHL